MDEKDIKKFMIPAMMVILAVFSFFIIRPIFVSIFLGLLFTYIFYPLYLNINAKIKSKSISASIVVLLTVLVVLIPIALITPFFIKQLFEVYLSMKGADFSSVIFKIFPVLASSQAISSEITAAASHFNAKISGWLLEIFQNTLMNIPAILFGVAILLFTFFFGLKEGENLQDYLSIIFPIPKEHQKNFYKRFGEVTNSVVYGHIIIGIIQGIVLAVGYYMFGIPNALILTVLTTVVGILPVVGPWFIWIPVDFFLFLNGNSTAGMQLLIFSLFLVSWTEILLRPVIVAERAEMNPAIALIGAVGGIYAFGVIGFVLGPLVLAYLILLIEIYKDKKTESIIVRENPEVKQEVKT